MHELQPGTVAVLQVGQLVGEHHRVGAPVAVEDGDRGSPSASAVAASDSTGVIPDPATTNTCSAGGGQVGGEAALRRQHLDLVARAHLVHQPGGEEPTGHLADADPQRAHPPARRSSRSRRSSRPSSVRRRVSDWPGRKTSPAQLGRDVEGDRDASSVSRSTARHPQRVERRRAPRRRGQSQISFTCSNGSRQVRHRRSALHAVAPNSLSSSVSADPQSGQDAARRVTPSCSGTGPAGGPAPARAGRSPPRAACGGPRGDPVGASRPARARCGRRRRRTPPGAARATRSARMTPIAGQPV